MSISGDQQAIYRHPVHGEGRVRWTRRGGREVLFVTTKGNLGFWVQPETLIRLDRGESDRALRAPAVAAVPMEREVTAIAVAPSSSEGRLAPHVASPSLHGAGTVPPRAAIEALRLGVVPAEGIESFTVGLALERALIEEDLGRASRSGCVRFFTAPYGSGKSHTLELVARMASARGFAIAHTEIDGFSVSFRRPKRFVRSLIRGLRLPGVSETGIGALIERVRPTRDGDESLSGWATRCLGELRILGPAVYNYWRSDTSDVRGLLVGYMAGDEVPCSHLNNRRNLDKSLGRFRAIPNNSAPTGIDAAVDLIADVARLVKLAGLKGLALLVDEGEHYRDLTSAMQFRADRLMSSLLSKVVTGSAPHCVLMMAMTPIPGESAYPDWVYEDRLSEINPPSVDEAIEFFRRFGSLYAKAYPGTPEGPSDGEIEQLAELLVGSEGSVESVRMLTKAIVYAWDLVRLRGLSWTDLIQPAAV